MNYDVYQGTIDSSLRMATRPSAARQRGPPAVVLRRARSDETIFQSLRSRPEMITGYR